MGRIRLVVAGVLALAAAACASTGPVASQSTAAAAHSADRCTAVSVSASPLVMQDWSASNSWTWDTTGTRAGRYAIRVDARAYGIASGNPDATGQVEVDVVNPAP